MLQENQSVTDAKLSSLRRDLLLYFHRNAQIQELNLVNQELSYWQCCKVAKRSESLCSIRPAERSPSVAKTDKSRSKPLFVVSFFQWFVAKNRKLINWGRALHGCQPRNAGCWRCDLDRSIHFPSEIFSTRQLLWPMEIKGLGLKYSLFLISSKSLFPFAFIGSK